VGTGAVMQTIMNVYVLWVVKPCSLVAGTNVSEQTTTSRANVCPKNGGKMFLQNICTYPSNYAGVRRQKTAVLKLNATFSKMWQEI
jgi:hypothetical protein